MTVRIVGSPMGYTRRKIHTDIIISGITRRDGKGAGRQSGCESRPTESQKGQNARVCQHSLGRAYAVEGEVLQRLAGEGSEALRGPEECEVCVCVVFCGQLISDCCQSAHTCRE